MNALTKHATRIAVSANGLRKVYGEKVVLDGVDLRIGEARSSHCSGRTAPARPPS